MKTLSKTEQHLVKEYLNKLASLNKFFKPAPWQQPVIKAIFKDGYKLVFICAGRSSGKALALNTPILTPDGYKTMGEITAGDKVFGIDGKPCNVIEAHDVIENAVMYRVHFADGETIDACEDHLWEVSTKAIRKAWGRKKKDLPERAVLKTKELTSVKVHGEYNYAIRTPQPLRLPERDDLLIDPYVLGVWLGDGGKHTGIVTNPEPEIWDEIAARWPEKIGNDVSSKDRCRAHTIFGLAALLRAEGLLHNKHVPQKYLLSSYQQRLDLLHGLMDTDGSANKQGTCEFYSTNKQLADSVMFLVRSLGGIATVRSKMGKLYGVEKKRCYTVSFSPPFMAFKLSRKAERQNFRKRPNHKFIHKIEKLPNAKARCITVDGPDSLYLAGTGLTPTHNTFSTKYILFRSAYCFPGTSNYMIGPTRKQQAEIAWEQSDGLPNFLPLSKMGGVAKNSEHRIEFETTGSFIKLDGSEEYYSYRGVPFHIMVLDEWQNQDPRFLDAAYPNLFKRKEAVLIIIGHPSSAGENHFDAKYAEAKRDKRWFVAQATCFDNPYLDRVALELEKQAYIARGELYEWLCEYEAKRTAGGKRAVFPMFSEDRHVKPREVILQEIERDARNLVWGIGLDPGSATCFAGCLMAYNPYLGKVYLLDELYVQDPSMTSTGVIWPKVREMKRHIPPGLDCDVVYDEAAKWFEREVAEQFGEGITPSQKSKNDKEDGLSLIKDLMIQDKFVIAEECHNGIDEIKKYSREEDGKIKKKKDHYLDSARYILAELGVVARPSVLSATQNDRFLYTRKVAPSLAEDYDFEELIGEIGMGEMGGDIETW